MSDIELKLKHVKAIIKSLLISSNKQFYTVKDLVHDYNNQRGTPIPYKELGYGTIHEFLKKIPDTIEICGTPEFIHLKAVSTNKTKHLTQLITTQKKKPENKNFRNGRNNRYSGNGQHQQQKPKSPVKNPFIPHEIQDFIYNFLKDKPLGVPEDFLESHIRKNTSFNLDEMDGILGIINFCTLFKMKGGIVTLNNENSTLPSKSSSQLEKSNSERIKAVIVDILKKHPEGLLCSDFSDIYKSKYRISIDFGALGYTSLLQYLANMNDFIVLKKVNQYDWHIVLKEFFNKEELNISSNLNLSKDKLQPADLNRSLSQDSNLSSEHDSLRTTSITSHKTTPSRPSSENDASRTESLTIPQQRLSSLKGDVLPIIITEIYSPTLFWVNLYSPEIITSFYDFFEDIQEYYKHNAYSMKISNWNETKYAIAFYQNEWHRVIILNKPSDTSANVFFIDSGTKISLNLDKIFKMKEEFYKMPSQAICATLSNVAIPSHSQQWLKESTIRFRDLVSNKPLLAIIKTIDHEANFFSGLLIDTSTKKDMNINSRLIEERLADEFIDNNKSLNNTSSSTDNHSNFSNEYFLKFFINKSFKNFEQLNNILNTPLIRHRITINPNFQIRELYKITLDNNLKTPLVATPKENKKQQRQKLKQIYLGSLS